MVLDEGWLYKNHASRRSINVELITRRLPALLLSGSTMTARNIEDLYGQAKAVGLDEYLAANITDFRSRYTVAVKNYAGFIDRYPKRKAMEEIRERLANNISVYFPKEIREIKNITQRVDPSVEQLRVKQELVKNYYYEHLESEHFEVEVKSATALLIKLQQVSDGFLYDQQGGVLPVRSNKTIRLKELCAELLEAGERVLIWVAFRQTAKVLCEALQCESVILSGGQPFDWEAWRSGNAKICLATIGSGASLNDFADLRYAIFYSSTYNYLQVQQAKGRTNRKGHRHGLYYYYLNTVGFPDENVWDMLGTSESAEQYAKRTLTRIVANTDVV